jgi:ATP-dependent Zn protease
VKTKALADTAHHEAAHAVAAWRQQVTLKYATIVPGKDSLGHIRTQGVKWTGNGELGYEFDSSRRGIDRAERHIVTYYAGPLASKRFSPRSRWRIGGSGDFASAAQLLSRIGGADEKHTYLYSQLLWRRAECLVEVNWKNIERVAAALLEHQTLNRKQVIEAIMGGRS